MKTTKNTPELYSLMREYYSIACRAGKCQTQEDFALFVGIGEHTIRRALSNTAVSPKTVSITRQRLEQAGLLHPASPVSVGDCSVVQSPDGVAGVTSADHRAVVEQFITELAAQRSSYERLLMAAIAGKIDK